MSLIGSENLWHAMSLKEAENALKTDYKKGLEPEEVLKRRTKHGKNTFEKRKEISWLKKLFNQLKNPLVAILVIAGLITLFLGEYIDTAVIFIAVFINILIGSLQEERASKAFQKLNATQKHFTSVLRDGKKFLIPIEELVQGDIVIMEAGNFVPADIRLVQTNNFEVNESALTGEWVSVPKDFQLVNENKPLSEQSSMAWMGTLVSSGNALGVVVEVGENTQIGRIASSLKEENESKTPIQKNIKRLANFLALVITIIVLIIFGLGIFRGEPLGEMLLISVAMAVSVIPEGMPAAVTVVLVLGMERILKKGGLVRNLLAAETLGSTTIILTDKTGTLTKGQMKMSSIYTINSLLEKEGGEADNQELLKMAILSSDAFVEKSQKDSEIVVRGRPLEKAIVLAGLESGLNYADLEESDKRIDFLPFESKNGFLASLNYFARTKERRIYLSGAPEKLLKHSEFVFKNGKSAKLSKEIRDSFSRVQEKWSRQGMRFIALAYKETKARKLPKKNLNKTKEYKDLVFVGLLSFEDSVREDVPSAIETAKKAGAKVLMITGDNKYTAQKIAQDVGIAKMGDKILEGKDIEKMNDKDLLEMLDRVKVFARVLPSQKLRISKILQGRGEIVAMTGDGVNDAPALKGAHIGVAVESATEVAKESSDLILIDNSFSVIVRAIEEGRRIMDNLKKIVSYLLSTSFGEIFVIGGALAFGLPLPILPAQILWINIVEEGVMNFAFAFEPKERDLMKRDPSDIHSKRILTAGVKKLIFIIGFITGLLAIAIYFLLLRLGLPIEEIRTVIFAVLALDPIFFAFSFKSLREPIWKENIFSNKYLILSVLLSFILLFGALSLGPLRELLRLVPLSLEDLGLLLGVGVFNLFLIEITKFFVFRGRKS